MEKSEKKKRRHRTDNPDKHKHKEQHTMANAKQHNLPSERLEIDTEDNKALAQDATVRKHLGLCVAPKAGRKITIVSQFSGNV